MPELHIGPSFPLDTDDFRDEGLRIGIFASPGAGKGYLLGVLLEEFIGAGYPCLMVDAESELWTFRELGALIVGGPHGHVPFDVAAGDAIRAAIRFCLDTGTPVVFDLGDCEDDREIRAGFEAIAGQYWGIVNRERHSSVFAVTEAHVIAPQALPRGETAGTRLPAILNRGRKRGVISLLETQRIADVANAVISHCNVRFVGRIDFEDDYRRVARSMPRDVTFADIAALERGTFYVPRLSSEQVHVRQRTVTHGGGTPDGSEVTLRREATPEGLTQIAEQLSALMRGGSEDVVPPSQSSDSPRTTRSRRVRTAEDAALEAAHEEALAEARTRAERAEARADAMAARLEALERVNAQLVEENDAAIALRAALANFMGAVEAGGGISEARVIALISEHARSGSQSAVLMPVAALRAQYLERAATRLYVAMRALEPDAREALCFLLTRDQYVTINAVSVALSGSDSGSSRQRWSKAVQALVSAGLASAGGSGRTGRRATVDAWVRSALSPHDPSDEEIEAVRDRALSVLLEGQQ